MTHPSEKSESRSSPLSRGTRVVCWLALALLLAMPLSQLRASVPPGQPDFTRPLNITNKYQPFRERGIKVFTGTKGSTKTVVVDDYLTETRTFQVRGVNDGQPVRCHILREVSFEDGQLVESTRNYFAQADDGTVYYFGEIVDLYQNGVITSHEGSWLVGGPATGTPPEDNPPENDPTDTATDKAPNVFMPANPEVRDVFKPEDKEDTTPPVVDETDLVVAVGLTVTVPAGVFHNVIRIFESSSLKSDTEDKWYARGVGVIKVRAKGETLDLIASTLRPQ